MVSNTCSFLKVKDAYHVPDYRKKHKPLKPLVTIAEGVSVGTLWTKDCEISYWSVGMTTAFTTHIHVKYYIIQSKI